MTNELKLVTWNVLAAPWASPIWYPAEMDSTVLDRQTRTALVAKALRNFDPDVICLQETTPPDLAYILRALGEGYAFHFASNSKELWANWGASETPWEPNGTAVILRSDRFIESASGEIELGPHGNVATWVRLVDVSNGKQIQIVSAHLDSDDDDRRRSELPALFDAISTSGAVVIAGDYNEDTISTGFGEPFFERGFADVFALLDNRLPTHPYFRPGDDLADRATIDHILVREVHAVTCDVIDVGIWSLEPAEKRMEELLRRTGSDHLALTVSLTL